MSSELYMKTASIVLHDAIFKCSTCINLTLSIGFSIQYFRSPVFSGKKYDIETSSWHNIASMHTKRSKMSMVECGGLLFVMGGFDGTTTINSVECYNPSTNRCACAFHDYSVLFKI